MCRAAQKYPTTSAMTMTTATVMDSRVCWSSQPKSKLGRLGMTWTLGSTFCVSA